MTHVGQTPSDGMSTTGSVRADLVEPTRTGMQAPALQRAIADHLRYSIGRPAAALRPEHYYRALALAVRDRMQDRRVASTQTSLDLGRKVTCYLSAEFLMGPQLGNNLLNLRMERAAKTALAAMGQNLDESWLARRNRDWATAASAGSPRATWTRWPPLNVQRSATASAMNSASSTRRSTTAGRSKRPTTGWPAETPGRSPNPTSTTWSRRKQTPANFSELR
jgi:hypothetical protein